MKHEVPDEDRSPPLIPDYGAYGCRLNACDVDELFARYRAAGFLYAAKVEKLGPYMPLVRENWRRALSLGESVLWFNTYSNDGDNSWASVASYRSTFAGWQSQHLVGMGGPRASGAVLLSGAAVRVARRATGTDLSQQNWYRPSNRYANRVFGSVVESVGSESAWLGMHYYLSVRPEWLGTAQSPFRISRCTLADGDELRSFAIDVRGPVFVQGEALDVDDLELDELNQIYARAGLSRTRRIYLARRGPSGPVVAIALAYRGPLGLNFSFLENRADIIVHPTLDSDDAHVAAQALLSAAAPYYRDFAPGFIPTIADHSVAELLMQGGAELIRPYARSIWLADAYVSYYKHLAGFYARIVGARRSAGTSDRRSADERADV